MILSAQTFCESLEIDMLTKCGPEGLPIRKPSPKGQHQITLSWYDKSLLRHSRQMRISYMNYVFEETKLQGKVIVPLIHAAKMVLRDLCLLQEASQARLS